MSFLDGWFWLALGLLILVIDIVLATGVLLAFAVASLCMALSLSLVSISWPWQLALFSAISLFTLLAYRNLSRVGSPRNATHRVRRRKYRLRGKRASMITDTHQGRGKVQIDDVVWVARCDQALRAGQLIEVVGYTKNDLEVQPLSTNTAHN